MLTPTSPSELLREIVIPSMGAEAFDGIDIDAPLTSETAEKIGKICGNGADFWLRLQAHYDEVI